MEKKCPKHLLRNLYSGPELTIKEAKCIMSKFDGGSVDLEKDEINCIAKIQLNNPRVKNAISGKMMIDLEKIVDELESWNECKGAILYGADGNFCSGGDLNMAKKANTAKDGYAMGTYMHYILDRFQKLPFITVAYIDGTGALGGGAELCTACDYRLINHSATIGFVHARMGVIPAWGGAGRLMKIVGHQKTMDLLLEAKPIPATHALQMGLIDGIVNTFSDAVHWLLHRVSKYPIDVINAIKYLRITYHQCPETTSLMERKIMAPLWGGPANQAALQQYIKHK
ncbi:ethylmalonyl-CoA decarboxylase-like isoform X2 [Daktulosphaira vitifoliae]|nr:ethylmalonyl-CoA decarboxylase-like isoform X2 [Daktulosphaira vitifoliae]